MNNWMLAGTASMSYELIRGRNTLYSVPACLWERHVPWISPEMLKLIQKRRLRRIVKHAWNHVPFYRESMENAGLTPMDIRRVEDLQLLPPYPNRVEIRWVDRVELTAGNKRKFVIHRF